MIRCAHHRCNFRHRNAELLFGEDRQNVIGLSDMDDSDLNISESDKAFTRSFYGME